MIGHKYDYFNALVEMAEFSCQAAEYLHDVAQNFDKDEIPMRMKTLHIIEHSADEKRHEIMRTLAKEFLPPIEREDIVAIASCIDDITDGIDDVMQHIFMYNIEQLFEECTEFTELIRQCCQSVLDIAHEFRHFRRSQTIQQHIIRTNNLESQGDALHSVFMRKLFTSDMGYLDIFKWVNIANLAESCCDFCERTSESFEMAIMRNTISRLCF